MLEFILPRSMKRRLPFFVLILLLSFAPTLATAKEDAKSSHIQTPKIMEASGDFVFQASEISLDARMETAPLEMSGSDQDSVQAHLFGESLVSFGKKAKDLGETLMDPAGAFSVDIVFARKSYGVYQLALIYAMEAAGGKRYEEKHNFEVSPEEVPQFLGTVSVKSLRTIFIQGTIQHFSQSAAQRPDFQKIWKPYLERLYQEILIQVQPQLLDFAAHFEDKKAEFLKKARLKEAIQSEDEKQPVFEEIKKEEPVLLKTEEDLKPFENIEGITEDLETETKPAIDQEAADLEPAVVEPSNQKLAKENFSVQDPGVSTYFEPLALYQELLQKRKTLQHGSSEFQSISSKMGEIQSQLQTMGYYKLSASKRAKIEQEIENSRAPVKVN